MAKNKAGQPGIYEPKEYSKAVNDSAMEVLNQPVATKKRESKYKPMDFSKQVEAAVGKKKKK